MDSRFGFWIDSSVQRVRPTVGSGFWSTATRSEIPPLTTC